MSVEPFRLHSRTRTRPTGIKDRLDLEAPGDATRARRRGDRISPALQTRGDLLHLLTAASGAPLGSGDQAVLSLLIGMKRKR
jgi:hypothetical protein